MPKGRKKAKFDFNLPVDISQTTTAKASKSCVIILPDFSNIFSKTSVRSESGTEMLKVTGNARFSFNLRVDIS